MQRREECFDVRKVWVLGGGILAFGGEVIDAGVLDLQWMLLAFYLVSSVSSLGSRLVEQTELQMFLA